MSLETVRRSEGVSIPPTVVVVFDFRFNLREGPPLLPAWGRKWPWYEAWRGLRRPWNRAVPSSLSKKSRRWRETPTKASYSQRRTSQSPEAAPSPTLSCQPLAGPGLVENCLFISPVSHSGELIWITHEKILIWPPLGPDFNRIFSGSHLSVCVNSAHGNRFSRMHWSVVHIKQWKDL